MFKRTLKKIVYSLLGILLTLVVVLVGFILYVEFSGNKLSPLSVESLVQGGNSREKSRLTYDEDGNFIEFPEGGSGSLSYAEEGTAPVEAADTAESVPQDASSLSSPVEIPVAASSDASSGLEYHFIMDLGSNLFHYETCDYVANISDANYSAKTATREQVVTAGFEACSHCRP